MISADGHAQKNFGSPLKNARNSDNVDCDDQSQDISLAPGQFLVITWEVYGRYGTLGLAIDGRSSSVIPCEPRYF